MQPRRRGLPQEKHRADLPDPDGQVAQRRRVRVRDLLNVRPQEASRVVPDPGEPFEAARAADPLEEPRVRQQHQRAESADHHRPLRPR